MRISSAKKGVVLLALLLCQLTVFAHIAQHAVLELDQTCQICVHAPGLDAAAVASAPAVPNLASAHETPVHASVVALILASFRYTPIRAPPIHIV